MIWQAARAAPLVQDLQVFMAQSSVSDKTVMERLGLATPMDLVLHFPLRYEDETRLASIAEARPGRSLNVEGEVMTAEVMNRPRRQLIATLRDDSGQIQLRWLHFYPSQIQQMQPGKRWRVRGEVRSGFGGLELVHPKVSQASAPLPQRLSPVYPSTEGLTQKGIMRAIESACEQVLLDDTLPEDVRYRLDLMPFEQAIRTLHWPRPTEDIHALELRTHPAWVRVKFDELLAQQLSLANARQSRQARRAQCLAPPSDQPSLTQRLLSSLPFALTRSQQKCLAEIQNDLEQPHPMHRLLQGDVGSGKTIVAMLAALRAIENGKQAAVMAPTEILSEQHFLKFDAWSKALGLNCVWLCAGLSARLKRQALADIESGSAHLIVGTQALIQDGVVFHDLGLAIVDEQHRFGVGQRLALAQKSERGVPHQLTMSATPIPRTLAMTFFADLDVSVIDERPPGRKPVKTKLVSAGRRDEIVAGIAHAVRDGGQAYWVCPLVEESETLQLQTATQTYETLQEMLPDIRIGLVHGRLHASEKSQVMQAFSRGEIDLLVATTVIEVGVDVPNAALMVIEHAERFGLAQLHQLRGRVGRGSEQSICILLFEPPLSQQAQVRLRAMYETEDGFEIAQRDLHLRGPGEFLGSRQSGLALLRFADYEADALWVERARELAVMLRSEHPEVAQAHLDRWMQGRQEYLNG